MVNFLIDKQETKYNKLKDVQEGMLKTIAQLFIVTRGIVNLNIKKSMVWRT